MTCECCGEERSAGDLVTLRSNPERGLCHDCTSWLAMRSGRVVVQPIMSVTDLAAATAFYRAAGFDVDEYDAGYAFVGRNGQELLHLTVPEDGKGPGRSECYIHTDQVDAWHADWNAAGIMVSPVADQPWGMHEFSVQDPSGNRLRIGRNSETPCA
jgi:predicted enzyme related to lactoylglutathione lyase